MGHSAALVAVEIDRDTHHAAKVAAVTARMQLRDWIDEAIRERIDRSGSQTAPAAPAGRRKPTAEDLQTVASLEIAESFVTIGAHVADIAEVRPFADVLKADS